jgi:hypothetical protein
MQTGLNGLQRNLPKQVHATERKKSRLKLIFETLTLSKHDYFCTDLKKHRWLFFCAFGKDILRLQWALYSLSQRCPGGNQERVIHAFWHYCTLYYTITSYCDNITSSMA